MKTEMQTFSGVMFDLANPRSEDVRALDVDVHLSRIARFTGATKQPYTVADHSVIAASVADELFGDDEITLAALCHDAEEAYTNDISPMAKAILGEAWDRYATPIKIAVGDALGVDLLNLPSRVHEIDQALLAVEAFALMADAREFPVPRGNATFITASKCFCDHMSQGPGRLRWIRRYLELTGNA